MFPPDNRRKPPNTHMKLLTSYISSSVEEIAGQPVISGRDVRFTS